MKIVISFDFELGWGVADSLAWKERECAGLYRSCHQLLPATIDFLRQKNVPATWAIVSNLLHEELPKDSFDYLAGSYKKAVEYFCNNAQLESRYARPLIEQVIDYSENEIATHSATHPYSQHPDICVGSYLEDIRRSVIDIEKVLSVRPARIVFPRDDAAFLQEVSSQLELGGRINPSMVSTGKGRISSYAKGMVTGIPPSHVLMAGSGRYFQSGSLLFNWFGGRASSLKKTYTKRMLRKLLSSAGKENTVNTIYHLWLHPFNLIRDPSVGAHFSQFVEAACALRDKGLLEFVTMQGAEDFVVARSPMHCSLEKIHD